MENSGSEPRNPHEHHSNGDAERLSMPAITPHLTYALVELRRTAMRYIDLKGKLAEMLSTRYDGIAFGTDLTQFISLFEKIEVHLDDSSRRGFVNGSHIGFEEDGVKSIERFERESLAFIRHVERTLGTKTFDRLGIRYRFSINATDVQSVAYSMLGLTIPNWSIRDFNVRLERDAEDWKTMLMLSPLYNATAEGPQFAGAFQIDIDQAKTNLAASDALQPQLVDAHVRAINLIEEAFTGSGGREV